MRARNPATSPASGNHLIGRRTFLHASAALLGTAPLRARAQATAPAKIGFLGNANPTAGASQLESFRRGLREAGLVDVRVDAQRRWYELRLGPLRELDAWLHPYRLLWDRALDDLEDHLDTMPDTGPAETEG